MSSEEFHTFLEQVEGLSAAVDGTANLTTMEGQIPCRCRRRQRQVRVAGEALDGAGVGNRLQFGFDIDQAMVPEVARSLGYLLAAFLRSVAPHD